MTTTEKITLSAGHSVIIVYAGCLESMLSAQGEPVGRYDYTTVARALAALARVSGREAADLAYMRTPDGILVWRDAEEMDRDSDGSSAFATIEAK
jgi:hypothetical protein